VFYTFKIISHKTRSTAWREFWRGTIFEYHISCFFIRLRDSCWYILLRQKCDKTTKKDLQNFCKSLIFNRRG